MHKVIKRYHITRVYRMRKEKTGGRFRAGPVFLICYQVQRGQVPPGAASAGRSGCSCRRTGNQKRKAPEALPGAAGAFVVLVYNLNIIAEKKPGRAGMICFYCCSVFPSWLQLPNRCSGARCSGGRVSASGQVQRGAAAASGSAAASVLVSGRGLVSGRRVVFCCCFRFPSDLIRAWSSDPAGPGSESQKIISV